jgi:hypothetical protein
MGSGPDGQLHSPKERQRYWARRDAGPKTTERNAGRREGYYFA